jgi:hypothetical protein
VPGENKVNHRRPDEGRLPAEIRNRNLYIQFRSITTRAAYSVNHEIGYGVGREGGIWAKEKVGRKTK